MEVIRSKRSFGDLGEDYAARLLKKKGYKIIERNFRTKLGEIDIVTRVGDSLIFVEVKTRWSKKYGLPEEAVTPWKLAKIRRVAQYFFISHPRLPQKGQIEVVAIEVEKGKVISAKIIKVD